MLRSFTIRFLFAICAFAGASHAQTGLASLTGTVTDQTGAVVAAVTVNARHVATGTTLTAITSSTGNYTIAQMPIGGYEISVESSGFKTFRRTGLNLAAAQTLRLDAALEVGTAAESVTVTADASLLKTETGELAHNVTISQMQNLPLLPVNGATGAVAAIGFRDPYAVALLIPGVQYSASATMIVNGNPSGSAQYRIEGQTSGQSGSLTVFTQFTQPSVDAVQEVAIQTSNFAAEFGTVGGGIFNVTMKSGTNQYHGSAYDYKVNEVLNAHHPYTHLRDRERRDDFGFTFGGPFRLPKLYDGKNKTFFFFSYEQFRTRPVVSSVSATVPIQAYRDGNFAQVITASGVNGVSRPLLVGTGTAQRSYVDPLGNTNIPQGAIFDPLSTRQVACNTAISPDCPAGNVVGYRTAFVGNQIPVSYFDPVAVKVQSLVPLPTGPNAAAGQIGNNYQKPFNANRTSQLPSLKADQNIRDFARLSVFWSFDGTNAQYTPGNGAFEGFPNPITSARGTFHNSTQVRINYDQTLTPTMQFHFGAGWSHLDFRDFSPNLDYNAEKELGLKGARLNRLFPNFNPGSSANLGGMNTLGPAVQSTGGSERRPSATTSLTWVRSNHTLKFGAEWRQDRFPVNVYTNTAGNYVFSGNGISTQPALQLVTLSQGSAGFGYANFLMGGVTGVTIAVPVNYRTNKHQWSMYVQDSWKATRKLTLDYGLRWDLGTYNKEDYGRLGDVSLTTPNAAVGGHPGGLIFETNCNCKFAKNYKLGFGPRVGFAYSVDRKTVVRGGLGVVYAATNWFGAGISNDANGGSPGYGEQIFALRDGIPASINPQWPLFTPDVGHPSNAVVAAPALIDPNAGRPARQFQWSFGVQREINSNLVVEASYVANRGTWWSAQGLTAFNEISEGVLAKYGIKVGDTADRALLISQMGNLSAAQRSTLAAKGVVTPWSGFPGTQTVRQSLRPFPQYNNAINPTVAPLGKTWYDALQLTITKRYSHGLTVNGNYTYSKTLAQMSSPDIFNRSLGKNLAGSDLPHQFRVSAEYQTPRARAGMPIIGNRVVSYALGGWGIGIYMQYQSAANLARPANGAAQPISDWLGRGPGSGQLKLGSDGQPMSPWAVNWTDYDGKVHAEPLDVNCKCFDPTKTVALNPLAWDSVPNGQWANSFSDIRTYRGVRRPQESANLSRNFRFKERITLQVRVEMNNVFNRMLLPQPTAGGNFAANPTAANGLFTGGFGTFGNLTTGASAPGAQRSGLFVGRVTF